MWTVLRWPISRSRRLAGASSLFLLRSSQKFWHIPRTGRFEICSSSAGKRGAGPRNRYGLKLGTWTWQVLDGSFRRQRPKAGSSRAVIYLTPVALEITLRLMAANQNGPLFRNTNRLPWTPDATNCRFQTLKNKLGVKFSLYSLRHTWMNRLLVGGVDAFTVAILAGHSDPSMLAKHYQHLSQNPEFLLKQARRVSA